MSGGEGARRVGRWGEALAAEYLRRQGYKLLSSGYCCRMGEIDLIGVRDGILAFVEVKTRQNERFGQGREFVDQRKQVRILAAAQQYLLEHPSCNGCSLGLTWQRLWLQRGPQRPIRRFITWKMRSM